jgi:KDO2-lipid IV(A) lauroyltransferase
MMTRLGLAFMRLLHRLLPPAVLGRLGEGLGGLLYALAGSRRRVGDTNLRLCFPELSADERESLLRRHFRALGRSLMLETVSWWGDRRQLEDLVRMEGLEHLTPHRGRPLILLAPHFVGLNIGGVRVTAELAPIVSIYTRIRDPRMDRLMLHARTRFVAREKEGGDERSEMYARNDGVKPVLRAMKRGLPLYYLPDMDFGTRDAVFVPFFGVPTATVTGLARLAKAAGAAVVPCVTRQTDSGYVTRFYPAWTDFPGGDVETDTRRMNAFIEERVREMPEQYFWLHQRFKSRPPGGAPVYD